MKVKLAVLFAAFSAFPTIAQEKPREPGALESWQDPTKIDSKAYWARMAIKIDKRGRPYDCRVVESNIKRKETRFWMCQGMLKSWKTEPVLENGKPIETTVMRRMVAPSRETWEAWDKAKEQSGE